MVAVVDGTADFDCMKSEHSCMDVFEEVGDAIDALLKEKTEAMVWDAPDLLDYAKREGIFKVAVIRKIFEPQI